MILAKPVGVGAASQRLIATGGRIGLSSIGRLAKSCETSCFHRFPNFSRTRRAAVLPNLRVHFRARDTCTATDINMRKARRAPRFPAKPHRSRKGCNRLTARIVVAISLRKRYAKLRIAGDRPPLQKNAPDYIFARVFRSQERRPRLGGNRFSTAHFRANCLSSAALCRPSLHLIFSRCVSTVFGLR